MKAEETIKMMFKEYPDLNLYREDCLDHLFMTIGNGYKWCKGQLVDCDVPKKLVEDYDDTNIKSRKVQQDKKLFKISFKKRLSNMEFLANNDKNPDVEIYRKPYERYLKTGRLLHGWYPYSETYSAINTIPADIKSDWKKLALECLECMKKDGIEPLLSNKTKKRLGIK